jgi:adenine phosphoribosyltransferase
MRSGERGAVPFDRMRIEGDVGAEWMTRLVRDIADYPRPGVMYRDITPLLGDADGFHRAITELGARFDDVGIDRVLGMEARGFIVAAPVAYRIKAGFVPVRKAGKLPWAVVREEYRLEYGTDKLEMHRDAIRPGERVLVIDDVLATGGTAAATCRLVEELGGVVVGLGFLIEIAALNGRAKLGERLIESLASY